MTLPIAITMGDAAGIGPEIIAKYFEAERPDDLIVIGDPGQLRRAIGLIGGHAKIVASIDDQDVKTGAKIAGNAPVIPVLATGNLPEALPYGEISAEAGRAAHDSILRAVDLALERRIAGIVTAPIHKEALKAAGIAHPGHTEILAERTGTRDFGMMLAEGPLRVILVSIHVSLREAIGRITPENLARTFHLAEEGCRALGIEKPRIAVAGLNPHAGENGLFGREEIETIAPAIAAARAEGLAVSGPYPPDTIFMRARRGEFDIVVAQYHDQGLIPIKLNGIEKGVNITVGLPIIRTSVDHGTAFDIAGKGIADPSSLAEAISVARKMAGIRGFQ